jgi:hypothetical protein
VGVQAILQVRAHTQRNTRSRLAAKTKSSESTDARDPPTLNLNLNLNPNPET